MLISMMGRFTPLQTDILNLGGVVCGVPGDLVSDNDRLECMERALARLRSETNQDFGFDIDRWHIFLLESENHRDEYTFDYAWKAVREAVPNLSSDTDRKRLVEILTSARS